MKKLCSHCQGHVSRDNKTGICAKCRHGILLDRYICVCGGRVYPYGNGRCRKCYDREVSEGNQPGIMKGFDRLHFSRMIKHAGWSVAALARRSGRPTSTIFSWLSGKQLPKEEEYRPVAAVLALIPCTHCGGTGWLDSSLPPLNLKSRRKAS